MDIAHEDSPIAQSRKRARHGIPVYATVKACIIGIGRNLEEAKKFGAENNHKFKNYQMIDTSKANISEVIRLNQYHMI